ncbi:hypothetical protein LTR53_015379 [Teratosphaeriaceae sp. CCFEE 6253]|nr:hypothetical protein LTR53_015379 [Teratosphaeriaceae sp. CCFEE 6253]
MPALSPYSKCACAHGGDKGNGCCNKKKTNLINAFAKIHERRLTGKTTITINYAARFKEDVDATADRPLVVNAFDLACQLQHLPALGRQKLYDVCMAQGGLKAAAKAQMKKTSKADEEIARLMAEVDEVRAAIDEAERANAAAADVLVAAMEVDLVLVKEEPKEESKMVVVTEEPEEESKMVVVKEEPEEESKMVVVKEEPEEESKMVVVKEEPEEESKMVLVKEEPKDEEPKDEEPKEESNLALVKEEPEEDSDLVLASIEPEEDSDLMLVKEESESESSSEEEEEGHAEAPPRRSYIRMHPLVRNPWALWQ